LLSQVLCNMAGLVGPNDVRAAVQKMVEKKEGSWDDGDWSVFVEDVVSFLLHNRENHRDVVAAAVGLIMYRATTLEKLQGVGQGAYAEFTRKLAAKGVPDAICDMLFGKYVSKKQRLASGTLTSARPVKRALHDGRAWARANMRSSRASWPPRVCLTQSATCCTPST
jgi:hypothetical protein